MPQRIRQALQRGDSAALLQGVAEAFREGSSPRVIAEEGLQHLLVESGWELRGARWSHAFLCLEAAHRLARSERSELAQPAVVAALAFLDGSSPTRDRPLDPALSGGGGEEFERAVEQSDLPVAEAALIDLLDHPDLERRWFDAGCSNFEGWGHRPLITAACWRLSTELEVPRGWLLRAGLRQWIPWEVEPIRESGDPPVQRRGAVEWTAESIANAVLAGGGPSFVSSALTAGVSSSTIVEGITQAACHVFSALPELRQLHGVTVSRAVGEGVLFHQASPHVALVELARFVGLGWSSAQRSGRILPGREVSHLIEPGLDFDPEISLLLCQREATPNFGHLIKLVDAASALPALMSPGLGERWAGEVLRAASRKATPYRRVWATVQRHLLASI